VKSPDGAGATSFLEVPAGVVDGLGGGKRPPVKVTLNGFTWRTTVAVYGGEYYLGVPRPVREQAKVVFDEPVDVLVELDTEPREVAVPDELRELLEANPAAAALFVRLSYSHRKEYVDWIASAKREETRRRRVEQALEMLQRGVRTPR